MSRTRKGLPAVALRGLGAAGLAVAAGSQPVLSVAQARVVVSPVPECAACVQLELTGTLGVGESRDYVERTSVIASTGSRYAFSVSSRAHQLIEVDLAGRVLHVVGTRGDGPGEFRRIRAITPGPGDSLYVFDSRTTRLTVLGPSRAVERTVQIPPLAFGVPPLRFENGDWLINTAIPSRDLAGLPLHRIDAEGRVVRTYEVPAGETRQDRLFGPGQVRHMVPAGRDSVWVAHMLDYRLDLYDGTGRIVRSLHGTPPWAHEPTTAEQVSGRPLPAVVGLGRTENGTLIVVSRVEDPRWRDGIRETRRGGFSVPRYELYYNAVVDFIDPNGARLLARREVDPFLVRFVGPNTIAAQRGSEIGEEFLDIYRLSMAGPGRREPGPEVSDPQRLRLLR